MSRPVQPGPALGLEDADEVEADRLREEEEDAEEERELESSRKMSIAIIASQNFSGRRTLEQEIADEQEPDDEPDDVDHGQSLSQARAYRAQSPKKTHGDEHEEDVAHDAAPPRRTASALLSVKENVAPCPSRLSTPTVAAVGLDDLLDDGQPEPRAPVSGSCPGTRKNGSKILARYFAGMPAPVSATEKRTDVLLFLGATR